MLLESSSPSPSSAFFLFRFVALLPPLVTLVGWFELSRFPLNDVAVGVGAWDGVVWADEGAGELSYVRSISIWLPHRTSKLSTHIEAVERCTTPREYTVCIIDNGLFPTRPSTAGACSASTRRAFDVVVETLDNVSSTGCFFKVVSFKLVDTIF